MEVKVADRALKDPVFGPVRLNAFVDYDYVDGDSLQDLQFRDQSGERKIVLPFSLGQLEPQEAAHEASALPLDRKIAQKIVDVLEAQW